MIWAHIIFKCCLLTASVSHNNNAISCDISYTHVAYWEEYKLINNTIRNGQILIENNQTRFNISSDGDLRVLNVSSELTTDYGKNYCVDFDQNDNFVAVIKNEKDPTLECMGSMFLTDGKLTQFITIQVLIIIFLLITTIIFIISAYKEKPIFHECFCLLGFQTLMFAVNIIANGCWMNAILNFAAEFSYKAIFVFATAMCFYIFHSSKMLFPASCILSAILVIAENKNNFASNIFENENNAFAFRFFLSILGVLVLIGTKINFNIKFEKIEAGVNVMYTHFIWLTLITFISWIIELILYYENVNTYGSIPAIRGFYVLILSSLLMFRLYCEKECANDVKATLNQNEKEKLCREEPA